VLLMTLLAGQSRQLATQQFTVLDILPMVMLMLAFTMFPWRLQWQPPHYDTIVEEEVEIRNNGFFKDSRTNLIAYQRGSEWGRILVWPGSPIKNLTGTVMIRSYRYKNNRSEWVVFPVSLRQGTKDYLTREDYAQYVDDWWQGIYSTLAIEFVLIVCGFYFLHRWNKFELNFIRQFYKKSTVVNKQGNERTCKE
jgi:hypothetical protein